MAVYKRWHKISHTLDGAKVNISSKTSFLWNDMS